MNFSVALLFVNRREAYRCLFMTVGDCVKNLPKSVGLSIFAPLDSYLYLSTGISYNPLFEQMGRDKLSTRLQKLLKNASK